MKIYLAAVTTEEEDVPGDHVLAVHHGCTRLEDVRAAEGGVCRPVARLPLHDRARLRQHHHRCVIVFVVVVVVVAVAAAGSSSALQ